MTNPSIRSLAKDALKNMWNHTTTPQNYVSGGCSFCKIAEGVCKNCLLPYYFCDKVDGKLLPNTIISVIREARDFLLRPIHRGSKTFAIYYKLLVFNACLILIKRGIKDLRWFGKVRKKTEKRILDFINKNDMST